MTAEEFAAAVFAAYPVPEETFAKAKWMGEAALYIAEGDEFVRYAVVCR